jgi:hypothetical protein
MPKKVSLVVLCEDEMHQSFVAAFLNRISLPLNGRPRIEPLGSRSRVMERFPTEVRALRQAHAERRLLIVVDADKDTPASVEAQFIQKLKEAGVSDNISGDPILFVIPKWELENWALDLMGKSIGELRDPGARGKIGDDVRESGRLLADACQKHSIPGTPLPSLQNSCNRWKAFRSAHPL